MRLGAPRPGADGSTRVARSPQLRADTAPREALEDSLSSRGPRALRPTILALALAGIPRLRRPAVPRRSRTPRGGGRISPAAIAPTARAIAYDRTLDARSAADAVGGGSPASAEPRTARVRHRQRTFRYERRGRRILHPERRLIAYHLFWDDDIDFPDDNNPSDHEVVWIAYDAAGALVRVVTLFHGRLVDGSSTAVEEARRRGQRPRIDVQWGKHGPMHEGWRQLSDPHRRIRSRYRHP